MVMPSPVMASISATSESLSLHRGVERPLQFPGSDSSLELENINSMDKLLLTLSRVCDQLQGDGLDSGLVKNIVHLSAGLKAFGSVVEEFYKEKLDQLLVCLREACKNTSLDLVVRIHILEVIELRALNWAPNEACEAYYREKLAWAESCGSLRAPSLGGTIRNQSHGSHCKTYSLPQPSLDYKLTVTVGDQKLAIVGASAALAKAAKVVLDEHVGELSHCPSADVVMPAERCSPAPDPKLSRSVKVIRQPLFPGSTPEAFQQVEDELNSKAERKAFDRRANFAKISAASPNISSNIGGNSSSNIGSGETAEDFKDSGSKRRIRCYEREVLLSLADAPCARKVPDWLEAIFVELPVLRRSSPSRGDKEQSV